MPDADLLSPDKNTANFHSFDFTKASIPPADGKFFSFIIFFLYKLCFFAIMIIALLCGLERAPTF